MQKVIAKMRMYTAINNHNEALIVLATFLDKPETVKDLKDIEKKQDKAGYLTDELKVMRYAIYQDLLKVAKSTLDEESFRKIYQSL